MARPGSVTNPDVTYVFAPALFTFATDYSNRLGIRNLRWLMQAAFKLEMQTRWLNDHGGEIPGEYVAPDSQCSYFGMRLRRATFTAARQRARRIDAHRSQTTTGRLTTATDCFPSS